MRFQKTDPKATFTKAHKSDAGYDLTACSYYGTTDGKYYYDLGIKVAIPEDYVGLLIARSSIVRKEAMLANCVGVVDSGYRGNLVAVFTSPNPPYEVGERCCQLVVLPIYSLEAEEVDSLSDSTRGTRGFGSSGK
jgi:dUTP pyrophosphatase